MKKQFFYNNDIEKLNEDNNIILIGERNGIILPGFDYGNSPSQIENVDFSEKVVIHTTSCGTQGIVKSVNAKQIINSMYRAAKSLELVEVWVYGCFILCSYLFMRKTLIMVRFLCIKFLVFNIIYNYFPKIKKLDFGK